MHDIQSSKPSPPLEITVHPSRFQVWFPAITESSFPGKEVSRVRFPAVSSWLLSLGRQAWALMVENQAWKLPGWEWIGKVFAEVDILPCHPFWEFWDHCLYVTSTPSDRDSSVSQLQPMACLCMKVVWWFEAAVQVKAHSVQRLSSRCYSHSVQRLSSRCYCFFFLFFFNDFFHCALSMWIFLGQGFNSATAGTLFTGSDKPDPYPAEPPGNSWCILLLHLVESVLTWV